MPDAFGAEPIATLFPPEGEPVSDPALFRIASFLQAVLNAYKLGEWQAVHPGKLPVQQVFTHNPEDIVFNARDLPALFIYRQSGEKFEWLAEDYDLSHEMLRLLWVFPPAPQDKQRLRSTFVNAAVKVLMHFIELGRDPSYVMPGDTDPTAQAKGSVIYKVASIWEIEWRSYKVAPSLPIKVDSITRKYFCLDCQIALAERRTFDIVADFPASTRDNTASPSTGGLNLTLTNPDGTLVLDEAQV